MYNINRNHFGQYIKFQQHTKSSTIYYISKSVVFYLDTFIYMPIIL